MPEEVTLPMTGIKIYCSHTHYEGVHLVNFHKS